MVKKRVRDKHHEKVLNVQKEEMKVISLSSFLLKLNIDRKKTVIKVKVKISCSCKMPKLTFLNLTESCNW